MLSTSRSTSVDRLTEELLSNPEQSVPVINLYDQFKQAIANDFPYEPSMLETDHWPPYPKFTHPVTGAIWRQFVKNVHHIAIVNQ